MSSIPEPDAATVETGAGHDFVVVASRLPVDRVEEPDGGTSWRPSPGGPTSPGVGELPFRQPGKHGFVVSIMLAGRASG